MVVLELKLTKVARRALQSKLLLPYIKRHEYGRELCFKEGYKNYSGGFVRFSDDEFLHYSGNVYSFQYKVHGVPKDGSKHLDDFSKITLDFNNELAWCNGKNGKPSPAGIAGLQQLEIMITLQFGNDWFFGNPLSFEASPIIAEDPNNQQYFDIDFPDAALVKSLRTEYKTKTFQDVICPEFEPFPSKKFEESLTKEIVRLENEITSLVS